ncbi:MAG: Ig-like domain-containing protein [Puniceicoccaceae bacterium]
MKAVFFRSFSCLLFCLAALRSHGDLLVQAPTSATAGVEVELEYFSSHTLPPDGQFHQAVVILDEQVIAQGSDPSGTLHLEFPTPGSIRFEVRVYGVDGSMLDSVERSISVFGLAMIEPADQTLAGLGSRLYLGASAIFQDRWVDAVEFEFRREGESTYRRIAGSRDSTAPYSVLYEPPSSGLWQIRARAMHPHGQSTVSQPITLQVVSSDFHEPASVTILDPSPGGSVQAGIVQWVNVDTSSRSGVVRGVTLFVDGQRVDSSEPMDVTFPFRFEWTPLRPGPHTLVAIVTDQYGMRWASEPVEVMATDDRPHAELLVPRERATYPAGSQIPLIALAAGQGGGRERVGLLEFRVNGNVIAHTEGSQTQDGPFSANWTPAFPGTYFLQVRVVDSVTGASYQSSGVEVIITEANPPATAILNPSHGSFWEAGDVVRLRASATAGQGLVESVSFWINQVQIGHGVHAQGAYELDYQFEASGLYHITARVQSTNGQVTDSIPVSVTVTSMRGVRPTVELEQPTPNSIFQTGDTIQLVARANDTDGNVRQVEFFANRRPLGDPVTSYPFVVDDYSFGSAGHYRFAAVAVDDQGNRSERAEVTVQVKDPQWQRPTISIRHPVHEAVFEVGDTLYMEVDAQDADGVVQQVHFEINGARHGEIDESYPFQSEFFTIATPGIYRMVAIAVDDQGYLSVPAELTVYAVPPEQVEGSQFDPLERDRDFLTQLYLDFFLRGPTDAEMNRYLEFLEFGSMDRAEVAAALSENREFENLLHSQNAYQAIFEEWPSPQDFAEMLRTDETAEAQLNPTHSAGTSFERATVIDVDSGMISGVLEHAGISHYYSFQLDQESVVTLYSSGPLDTIGTLFNNERMQLNRDDDSGTFFNFAMQHVLSPGVYYLSVAGWGAQTGSYTLHFQMGQGSIDLPQSSEVSHADLHATISRLYESDRFRNRFGELPVLESDTQRRKHFQHLFTNRFGKEPTLQQTVQASNRLLESSNLAAFTAAFVRNDRIGMQDYIYDLPDVSSRDDAAFLVRALLKQQPDTDSMEPLLNLDFKSKVEAIFSSPAYRERFRVDSESEALLVPHRFEQTPAPFEMPQYGSQLVIESGDPVLSENPFHHLPENEAGWKWVDWLGWISDANYPMLFHSDLGWIHIRPLQPDALWVWHEQLDWSYFAAGIFPRVYRYSDEKWLELIPGEHPGDFDIKPLEPTQGSESN